MDLYQRSLQQQEEKNPHVTKIMGMKRAIFALHATQIMD